MMTKKVISFVLVMAIIMSTLLLSSCINNGELSYYDENGEVNERIFYKNELDHIGADPGCIYVSEGEGAGYFYLYATSDPIQNKGFIGWRSKDLNNWESIGVVYMPEEDSLCKTMLWAPEVIYNRNDDLYYLYYSARRDDYVMSKEGDIEYLTLCVAYSSSPEGPFKQWEGVNALGERLEANDELINFQDHTGTDKHWCTIDVSPFFDKDGSLYLYFSNTDPTDSSKTGVWGMKMLDAVTPDYSTLKQLTRSGWSNMNEYDSFTVDGEGINEAPFMLEHDGKYYLTYSTYGFTSPMYSVCLAVADDPLGDFVKTPTNPILGKESHFDHMTGTGHHCFVEADDQLFAVYHAHTERGYVSQSVRSIAFDEAVFVYDEELGYDTLHVNGPTYSVQPLPSVFSGYENCMSDAKITVTNLKSGSKTLLSDGLVTIHSWELDKEIRVDKNTKITIELKESRNATAVMIYNSAEISFAFDKIDSIIIYLDTSAIPKESPYYGSSVIKVNDIEFNKDYFMEDMFIRPGGAAICEFVAVPIKKIEIVISSKYLSNIDDSDIGISEIKILAEK